MSKWLFVLMCVLLLFGLDGIDVYVLNKFFKNV